MNIEEIRLELYSVLDELGIIVDTMQDDFDLQEYIFDSFTFINFVMGIEKHLNIEIPDELLLIENMTSFVAYCETILKLVNETCTVE